MSVPNSNPDHDVIVVGSGPTGLLLAGDLAADGVSVTVLEKRPPGISNLTRAFGVHARTLEQLDARGLADELVATGEPITTLRLFRNLSLDLSELPSRFPFLLITPQYEVENLLQHRAVENGVRFNYDAEVLGLQQDATGVDLRVRESDVIRTYRATYVVGADGHRSAVRHAIGLPFPGEPVIRSIVLADVLLTEPPEGLLTVNGNGEAFAFIAPFGDGWYRLMGWHRSHQVPDDAPLDLDEVKEIARLALGHDYGMHDPRWLSRFHSDERQVPAYRVGRVFLAGDAAHVHSPAGGQGMNTGLQDAANLSWKLSAVVNGCATGDLLDSYHDERHPVGKEVLRSSGTLVRLAMARSRFTRGLRSLGGLVVSKARPLRTKAIAQLTGIGFSYKARRGSHKLAGRRAPDAQLADGSRLYELLRQRRFVIVAPARQTAESGHRSDRVMYASWANGETTIQIIRPDGHIAWAGDNWDTDAIEMVLPMRRSCGATCSSSGPSRSESPGT